MLHAVVDISADTIGRYKEMNAELVNTAWLTDQDYPPEAWKEKGSSLWFSVPAEYGKYLVTERSDAFVMMLFWYAMVSGSDICFESPLSKRLYNGLTLKLIPALAKDGFRQIRLEGPVTDEPIWHEGGVVTGMSCGVDSLYTLRCYGGEDAPEGMRITHLAYYSCNGLLPRVKAPYDLDAIYEKAGRRHVQAVEKARAIAAERGLTFIDVHSNMDRDCYRGGLVFTAMYRYLACTLALSHLYSTYISSSSGNEGLGEASVTCGTQVYEDLITESSCTETLSYVSSGREKRTEKLRALADDADAQNCLTVCFNLDDNGDNCGECSGCWKTMIPLDIMGKLKGFGRRFDLDKYYSNRKKVFEDLVRFSQRPEASQYRDIVRQCAELAEEEKSEAGREFLEVREKTPGMSGN